jgi:hypothetical protein
MHPSRRQSPHRMRELPLAMLACIACLASGPAATGEAASMGWLGELAGRCWNSKEFGSQNCYWQTAADRLHFLSRSRGQWLDCGVLVAQTDAPGSLLSMNWSNAGVGETLQLTLSGQVLLLREDRPPYPEGVARVTVMTRPAANRFQIHRRGEYGEGGRRVGQEQIPSQALVFQAGEAFSGRDPDAQRCLSMEPRHAKNP